MSLPRSPTRPREGRKAPVITLNSVVLPAPLGPMKPQISFSGTSKLTSRNAATPPKYLVSVFTSRIFTSSPEEPSGPAKQSHQTIRLEQNNEDQQQPIQQQMDVGEIGVQLLLHHAENHAAQHGAPHGADPADHGHQQNRNPGIKSENVSRVKERCATRINSTGDSHQSRRDGMDFQ